MTPYPQAEQGTIEARSAARCWPEARKAYVICTRDYVFCRIQLDHASWHPPWRKEAKAKAEPEQIPEADYEVVEEEEEPSPPSSNQPVPNE